jgi:D-alanine-D-alanine ligase
MGVGEMKRVAVVLGGVSSEHDVSICTGLNVLDALPKAGFAGVPVYIDRSGEWHFGHRPAFPDLRVLQGAAPEAAAAQPAGAAAPAAAGRGVFERLRAQTDADVVFIALHGAGGEDGTIQGLCALAGMPFTGSGVLASALAMDKIMSKRVLAAAGIPVAPDRVVDARDEPESVRAAAAAVGYPCVVKPVVGGSSFATAIVQDEAALAAAAHASISGAGATMIEAFLDGVEVTCGVLGGGSEPSQVLPVTEIAPETDEFFDFHAKYTPGACREITPARIDAATTATVQELAEAAHRAIGCEGCSRSDFIVTATGPVMLEINTIPGMTETSLLPQGAAAVGIDFPELVGRLVRSALARG